MIGLLDDLAGIACGLVQTGVSVIRWLLTKPDLDDLWALGIEQEPEC